jgi:hypothetical protein
MPTPHVIDGKTHTLETEKWSRSGRTCVVKDENGKPTGRRHTEAG